MRNQPLLVSIVIAISVIFVIGGASLFAKLSDVKKDYKSEFAKRENLNITTDEGKLDGMNVPEVYLRSIRTFISKNFKNYVIARYKDKGFQIHAWKVIKCQFFKKTDNWEVVITIEGQYNDFR